MADDNTSFEYNIDFEKFVRDLLSDDTHEGSELDVRNPISIDIPEIEPIAVLCPHYPQVLFCTRCLTEHCQFCAFNVHMGHPVTLLEQAIVKANHVREVLAAEAKNVIFEIDDISRKIHQKIETLLSAVTHKILGETDRSPIVSVAQEEDNVFAATKSKQMFLQEQIIALQNARNVAAQTSHFLSNQLTFSVPIQLLNNENALADLNQCRLVANNASKVDELLSAEQTSTVFDESTHGEILFQGISAAVQDSHGYFVTKCQYPLDNFHRNGFLTGLPTSPLEDLFGKVGLKNASDEVASSGYSSSSSESDTNIKSNMAKAAPMTQPKKILVKGTKSKSEDTTSGAVSRVAPVVHAKKILARKSTHETQNSMSIKATNQEPSQPKEILVKGNSA